MRIFLFILIINCFIPYGIGQGHKENKYDFLIIRDVLPTYQPSYYRYINSTELKSQLSSSIVRELSSGEAIIRITSKSQKNNQQLLPVNNLWKLSPQLLEFSDIFDENTSIIMRVLPDLVDNTKFLIERYIPSMKILKQSSSVWIAQGVNKDNIDLLLSLDAVTHVGLHHPPSTERFIEGLDLNINQVSLVKSRFPSVNGKDLGIAVQENSMRLSDIDLLGKIKISDFASPLIDDHATNMATIIAGWGNSHKTGEGVARYAEIFPINFQFLLPLENDSYPDHVRTTNHSYGTDINNYYGVEAREFDTQVYNNPEMIHVFSAGNKGDSTSTIGTYAEVDGMANLSGSIKQAKNTLLIGAINSFGEVEDRSSRGPAYDGRLKPDLVAYGEDGTSGAAAIVSGISALLQDYHLENYGIFPRSDLIKACLIASAKDIYNPGPDYISGYGIARAHDAIKLLESEQYITGEVESDRGAGFYLDIPEGVKQVRVALSWIDTPAREGDFKSLVNDLDMKVLNQIDEQFLPQILPTEGSRENLLQSSVEGEDHINNTELIIIDNPRRLSYVIYIEAHETEDDVIPFAIAYHYIPRDSLSWEFPSKNDKINSRAGSYLRWSSTFEEGMSGRITIKNIGTGEVSLIKDIDTLGSGTTVELDFPIGAYQLMMDVGNNLYHSDTFTIYQDVQLDAVNLCGDELLLEWDFVPDVEEYDLLTIREDTLIPFLTTNSSSYEFIDISDFNTPYIAIRPVNGDGSIGHNSYTLNIEFIKAPCYIQFFSGYLENDDLIRLNLHISTTREVEDIEIFRMTSGIPELLDSFEPSVLMFSTEDNRVEIGENTYTAEITLKNGEVITRDFSIEFIPAGVFEILQNPIEEGSDIIVKKNAEQPAQFDMFTASGYKVRSLPLNGSLIFIDTSDLASGAYPYIIYSDDDIYKKGIIIII